MNTKEKSIPDSLVLQVNSMKEKYRSCGYPEDTMVALKTKVKELREKTMALEERFGLLSKLTIKVTRCHDLAFAERQPG